MKYEYIENKLLNAYVAVLKIIGSNSSTTRTLLNWGNVSNTLSHTSTKGLLPMILAIPNILYWAMMNFLIPIVAKILTQNWKSDLKENVYIISATALLTICQHIFLAFSVNQLSSGFVVLVLLLFYFLKIKSYCIKKSLILTLGVIITISALGLFVTTVTGFLFPIYWASIVTPLSMALSAALPLSFFLLALPYLFGNIIITILFAILFVKATRKLREIINQSKNAITALAIVSASLITFMQLAMTILHYQYDFLEFITSWEVFFLFGFMATLLVSVLFYVRSLRIQSALQRKETEQELFQHYISNIEQNLSTVRKMHHDWRNVFRSFYSFVEEKDLEGLERYYLSNIEPVFAGIVKNEFALGNFGKIKIPEIKSILLSHFMRAQSLDINTTFESPDEIDHIPVDSITLVRMLGIILDNAIEELTTLGAGKLMLACYKVGAGVTFVVQNTCRADIPPFHELKKLGYSSKGTGRGIGLKNLEELITAQSDTMTLQTTIQDGHFVQKLRIGGA
ncbi:MAG: GHKL domain-containing protein [Oscillospiraceae bacterium]|nr:GHKL domain-containing protein [Oscillospiraceae bacterium]